MNPLQGLLFLALVFRTAAGWTAGGYVTGVRAGGLAIFCLAYLLPEARGQDESTGAGITQTEVFLSTEYYERIRILPQDQTFFSYKVQEQLVDNFDRRSLELYVLRQHLRNHDYEEMRDNYAHTTKRRAERAFTRTAVRALENIPFVSNLRDGAWKERFLDLARDSITEDTPTIGTPILDDDPKIDYDVDAPIVQKPAWRDKVSIFIRPWSLHPNMGAGFKVDGIRAQFKAYHDGVKFSAYKQVTDDWSIYASARMKDYSPEDTSFSVGFQHTIWCIPGSPPALLQYGVSLRNKRIVREGQTHHEFRPNAFLAFVFDY